MQKPWPVLKSDSAAEEFVATADLTEYDFGQMVPMHFEYKGRDKEVTLSLPADLFRALDAQACKVGIPIEQYIREMLAQQLSYLHSD